MLRGIHKASANWLGRVVMAVVLGTIAVSFAIWGVGDIFRGFGQSTLAKIGRSEITVDQFRQIYSDRLQELSRRLGRPISAEEARARGYDRQILGQLIGETAMNERTIALKLGIPDAEIIRVITEDPNFRGLSGQFDRNRFLYTIRQAGYTEQRYLAEQRRLLLRQQLLTALTAEAGPPQPLIEAYHRFQNEQRAIEYVTFDRNSVGDIPAPTAEVLDKYYEERKGLFRTPEYRQIALVFLTAQDLAAAVEVSDADIKRAYEERRPRYNTPERRHVQQILFPNPEQARAAADRLAKGTTFETLINEPGIKERFTDLGMVAKTAMVDPAYADAAFSLKAGEVSAPVQGQFGTALLRVVKIEPGETRTLEQVTDEIKRDLALERAKRQLQEVRDKLEDERLDGKTLAQAAEKLGLKMRTIEAADRSGRDPNGKPIADLPANIDVIGAAFRSEVGQENEPLQLPGGEGYVWFDVLAVMPSRERKLDEIKDQVEARWRDDQIADRLKARTTEVLERLKGGATLAEIASANKLKLQTATGLKRGSAAAGFPLRALAEIFRVPNGAAGVAEGESATDRIVFRVTKTETPPFDANAPEGRRLVETLDRTLADEIVAQYLARLQTDIGVSINQNALNQVTGAAAN
ncbi:MAG TPA: SurA N-terminal domain-containing protein [Xanthobacteraceae bacterium]|nr:SurA N-terminal domain-containing protein [Xanthobacteraceae bacterium]